MTMAFVFQAPCRDLMSYWHRCGVCMYDMQGKGKRSACILLLKNLAPFRVPENFVLSQYQDLFGHPSGTLNGAGSFPSTVYVVTCSLTQAIPSKQRHRTPVQKEYCWWKKPAPLSFTKGGFISLVMHFCTPSSVQEFSHQPYSIYSACVCKGCVWWFSLARTNVWSFYSWLTHHNCISEVSSMFVCF